jgi:acyl-CoA thioesterase I
MGRPWWAIPAASNACLFFLVLVAGCSGDISSNTSQPQNPETPAQNPPQTLSQTLPQTPSQRSTATVRIMPLGDSITQSFSPLNSYRYYLWQVLVNQSYSVDFVGSMNGVANGPPGNPDFDMDHEGHAGWRADEILANIQVWATQASPDIVLLHIGTNDLCQGQSADSTVVDIGNIIDVLRMVNPKIQILLAQLIGQAPFANCGSPLLNAKLPTLVDDKNTARSPITLVDQYTGFDPSTMTFDGLHPNAIGDWRMADRWFEKLVPVLQTILTDAHFRTSRCQCTPIMVAQA